jgi:hypothetical protein
MIVWYIAISLLLLVVSSSLLRRSSDLLHRAIRVIQVVTIGALLALVISLIAPRLITDAYSHRPTPTDTRQVLFEGITYIRDVRSEPHPLVIHVILVDLDAPGIGFLVTPPNPAAGRQLRAGTTSQFLARSGAQLVINGDFFEPWRDNSPLDYYPYAGSPVDVVGFAASRGTVYSPGVANHPTLYLSANNQASFDAPIGDVYNAISGNLIFVQNGQPYQVNLSASYHQDIHPRTAVALDESGRTLILVVVDGRQSGYSEGVSMPELADIVIEHGGYTALNLDGGGSSALVIEDEWGKPAVLNAPMHNHMPYWERPVANHLGIYALALDN